MDAWAFGLERPHYRAVSHSVTFGSVRTSPLPLYHGYGGRMQEGERRADSPVKCCNMN